MRKVYLVGATSYTGEIIAAILRDKKMDFTMVGRNLEKLQELQARLGLSVPNLVANVSTGENVEASLQDAPVIINCVGPYQEFSRQFAKTVASTPGATYLDLTGEQMFVDLSFLENDEVAKSHGSLLMHAVAFESAYADLLAASICDPKKQYREILSVYKASYEASPGTAFTMALSKHRKVWILSNSEKIETKPFTVAKPLQILDGKKVYFIPYPEVSFWTRRYMVENCGSYFEWPEESAELLRKFADAPAAPLENIMKKHTSNHFPGPKEEVRKIQPCTVSVIASDANETRMAVMHAHDGYFFSAAIMVEAVAYILKVGTSITGVRGCGEVMPAEATFRILEKSYGATFETRTLPGV